jgi:hypothetical protein
VSRKVSEIASYLLFKREAKMTVPTAATPPTIAMPMYPSTNKSAQKRMGVK